MKRSASPVYDSSAETYPQFIGSTIQEQRDLLKRRRGLEAEIALITHASTKTQTNVVQVNCTTHGQPVLPTEPVCLVDYPPDPDGVLYDRSIDGIQETIKQNPHTREMQIPMNDANDLDSKNGQVLLKNPFLP